MSTQTNVRGFAVTMKSQTLNKLCPLFHQVLETQGFIDYSDMVRL